MSAIFGILRFDGTAVNQRELERMGNVLAHRGPDRRKFTVEGPAGLGHCLLKVNNEDVFEAQPLHDRQAKLTLVADARIDNREELSEAFGWSADVCHDRPDSAFILQACKKWGEAAPEHLLGDFVYALWDAGARKLILARDHMGQRCLLYHLGKSFLAFATTVKGLWAAADVPRALSKQHLTSLVLQDQDRPRDFTIFDGIRGVCGGTTMTVDAGGRETSRRYWEPRADPVHVGRDLDYYVAAYRRILEEAVACRIRRTTRPVALFFSGGFDSTAIAGLAGPVVKAQKRKLLAIVSGVSEDHRYAMKTGTPRIAWCKRDMPHLEVRYVEPDMGMMTAGLELLHADLQQPLGLSLLLDNDAYREASRAGARLVMDGHGGDYTLNSTGRGSLAYFLRTGQFRRFLKEFGAVHRVRRRAVWKILLMDVALQLVWGPLEGALRTIRAGMPLFGARTPVTKAILKEARAKGARPMGAFHLAVRLARSERFGRTLRRLQDEAHSPAADIASDFSMDFTRPFHDRRVVELAQALTGDFDLIDGRNRGLARLALGDIYPAEFSRIEKGFDSTVPDFVRMVQPHLPELGAEIARMERNPLLSEYFDFPAIRRRYAYELQRKTLPKQSMPLTVRAYFLARYVEWFSRGNR